MNYGFATISTYFATFVVRFYRLIIEAIHWPQVKGDGQNNDSLITELHKGEVNNETNQSQMSKVLHSKAAEIRLPNPDKTFNSG